ncbi:MAG: hypothetical protein AB8H79_04625, partial [Myxococcota bacterium]
MLPVLAMVLGTGLIISIGVVAAMVASRRSNKAKERQQDWPRIAEEFNLNYRTSGSFFDGGI